MGVGKTTRQRSGAETLLSAASLNAACSVLILFIKTLFILAVVSIVLSPLVWAKTDFEHNQDSAKNQDTGFQITSPSIVNGGTVPGKFTCDGQNTVPALRIEGVPANAKSLALIVDDADTSNRRWTHLALWNLPPAALAITEGKLPLNAIIASNDFGKIAYDGPCPPLKAKLTQHRYYFQAFALDSMINLPRASKRMDLDRMMQGHILNQTSFMALYERPGAVSTSKKSKKNATPDASLILPGPNTPR